MSIQSRSSYTQPGVPFPLKSLPSELRLIVYEHIHADISNLPPSSQLKQIGSLVHSSRNLAAEIFPVLYPKSTLSFDASRSQSSAIRRLGPIGRPLIRHICFENYFKDFFGDDSQKTPHWLDHLASMSALESITWSLPFGRDLANLELIRSLAGGIIAQSILSEQAVPKLLLEVELLGPGFTDPPPLHLAWWRAWTTHHVPKQGRIRDKAALMLAMLPRRELVFTVKCRMTGDLCEWLVGETGRAEGWRFEMSEGVDGEREQEPLGGEPLWPRIERYSFVRIEKEGKLERGKVSKPIPECFRHLLVLNPDLE